MIARDIEFLQPESIEEALDAWSDAKDAGKLPRYFAGGTELITRARDRGAEYNVLIDLKQIPECTRLDLAAGQIGSAVRLSTLSDQTELPLVAVASGGIADRTARNSITAGGNAFGLLPYREILLPLLLFDATITVASPSGAGVTTRPVAAVYEKRLRTDPGSFGVCFDVPRAVGNRCFYKRRTRDARIDYPIASLAMAEVDGTIRFAVGGVYGCPVRSTEAESILNDALQRGGAAEELRQAAEASIAAIPDRIWDDMRASAEYRREILIQLMTDGVRAIASGGTE